MENPMKILNATETTQAIPYNRLVPAIAVAMREKANNLIQAPERQVVPIDSASVLLSMPAIAHDIGICKLITVHAGNAKHGLATIQGEVIVFEALTGRRLALLDGPTCTARRTAAVTLLGIDQLANEKPASALIIGTGVQARAHIDALNDYFGIRQFWIAGRSIETAEAFCVTLRVRHPGIVAHATTGSAIQTTCPEVDVLIALTTSKIPVIPVHISPRTLAIGVGAFKPDMAEFPPELLNSRRIIVDDLAGSKHEAGDLIQANVNWPQVHELSEFLGSEKPISENLPVFKTVGQAVWDLAAARVAIATM
jgi:1-piperideine-2-carboxylate/1-pyrroline-2-carboxylate reductase [NAD(P)H]